MDSPRARRLIDDYQTNTWLIHRNVDGISDEDSLLQLPFQSNCLNIGQLDIVRAFVASRGSLE